MECGVWGAWAEIGEYGLVGKQAAVGAVGVLPARHWLSCDTFSVPTVLQLIPCNHHTHLARAQHCSTNPLSPTPNPC